MQEVVFLWVLGLIWIGFASIQDLRKREVSNWISFSLIIFALGFRFFYSLFNESFGFFWQGLIGLGIFFVLGNTLYYGRMFAGGDAKLMIALGAVLPFSAGFISNLKTFLAFVLIFLFAGAIYGIIVTVRISIGNFKAFKKDFANRFKKNRKTTNLIMGLGIILMIFGFFESVFLSVGILIFAFPYLYNYARSVDESCMVKNTKASELTEGDWLYQRVKVGRKFIESSWEGLSTEEIKLIRKNYKSVKIKQGIPFIPVFLIAYLVLIYVFNSGLWDLFW